MGRGARVSDFILQRIQILKKKNNFFLFWRRGGGGGGGGGDGGGGIHGRTNKQAQTNLPFPLL